LLVVREVEEVLEQESVEYVLQKDHRALVVDEIEAQRVVPVGGVLPPTDDSSHSLDVALHDAGLPFFFDPQHGAGLPCVVDRQHDESQMSCDGMALEVAWTVCDDAYCPYELFPPRKQASSSQAAHLPTLAFSLGQQTQAGRHYGLQRLLEQP
jgi:hypothetical protein